MPRHSLYRTSVVDLTVGSSKGERARVWVADVSGSLVECGLTIVHDEEQPDVAVGDSSDGDGQLDELAFRTKTRRSTRGRRRPSMRRARSVVVDRYGVRASW